MNADSFSKMSNLRLLRICNVAPPGSIEYLSNELQLLEWHACPLNSLPSNFQSDKLVELKMHLSRVKQLWNGNEVRLYSYAYLYYLCINQMFVLIHMIIFQILSELEHAKVHRSE